MWFSFMALNPIEHFKRHMFTSSTLDIFKGYNLIIII